MTTFFPYGGYHHKRGSPPSSYHTARSSPSDTSDTSDSTLEPPMEDNEAKSEERIDEEEEEDPQRTVRASASSASLQTAWKGVPRQRSRVSLAACDVASPRLREDSFLRDPILLAPATEDDSDSSSDSEREGGATPPLQRSPEHEAGVVPSPSPLNEVAISFPPHEEADPTPHTSSSPAHPSTPFPAHTPLPPTSTPAAAPSPSQSQSQSLSQPPSPAAALAALGALLPADRIADVPTIPGGDVSSLLLKALSAHLVFVAETEKTRAVAAASQGAAEAVAELALAKSAAAEARMVELEREKQDEADRASRLAERVHQLETEALALSTQYQQLDDQGATIRRLEAEQDMHADELRAALEHVAELEQDLGTRTHKVASLERDLASAREVADTVEGAREASVRQHTNLKSQYDLLKTHYEQLSALLEADVKEKTISAEKTRQLLEQRRWRASQEIKVERFV